MGRCVWLVLRLRLRRRSLGAAMTDHQTVEKDGMTMTSSQWLDALANAWDAGFDAASGRAQRAILLAHAVGYQNAVQQVEAEGPMRNPYRVTPPAGGAS